MSARACITLLIFANLFWSGSYAVIKFGLASMDPVVLVFWRLLVALILLATWVAFRSRPVGFDRSDLIRIVAAGLCLATSSFLTVTGIELSHATDASLLYVFEPVWGILLASLILKERFLISTGIGLALVLTGLMALSGFELSSLFGIGEPGVGLGNLLMVIGLLAESFFTIILKPVAKKRDASTVFAGVLLVAVVALSLHMASRPLFTVPVEPSSLFAIAYLSLICTAMGYTLWVGIMRHIPVNVMLFTIFIQPIAGMFIASATLGEPIEGRLLLGGLLLVAGMATAVVGHMRVEMRVRKSAEEEPVAIAP